MTITVRPAPDRNGGQLASPQEYEELSWWWAGDGVLDVPRGEALRTTTIGGGWETQPGRALVRGHIVESDAMETGQFSPNTGAARYDWVVLRVDFSAFGDSGTPNAAVTVVEGEPGAGYPLLFHDPLGAWDIPLFLAQVTSDGAAQWAQESRLFCDPPVSMGLFFDAFTNPAEGQRFYQWDQQNWYRWQGGMWVPDSPVQLIERIPTTTSVTFSNIPQMFHNLRIEWSGWHNGGVNRNVSDMRNFLVRFNGDNGPNYNSSMRQFLPTGGDIEQHASVGQAYLGMVGTSFDNQSSGTITIPNYASSQMDQSAHSTGFACHGGTVNNFGPFISGAVWNNTAPVTEVHIFMYGSDFQFADGTVFSLYGEI